MCLASSTGRSEDWRDAQEREEKTVRIKREHADAFGPDDDEDEIEWTGTRPVRTRVFGGVIDWGVPGSCMGRKELMGVDLWYRKISDILYTAMANGAFIQQ
jgi:hypothetical protein